MRSFRNREMGKLNARDSRRQIVQNLTGARPSEITEPIPNNPNRGQIENALNNIDGKLFHNDDLLEDLKEAKNAPDDFKQRIPQGDDPRLDYLDPIPNQQLTISVQIQENILVTQQKNLLNLLNTGTALGSNWP